MAFIRRSPTWPDPRVKPPPGAARVDANHALSAGLLLGSAFTERGGTIIRFEGGRDATLAGTRGWSGGPGGAGPDLVNAGAAYVTALAPQLATGTIVLRAFLRTLPASNHIFGLSTWREDGGAEADATYDKTMFLFPANASTVNLRYYIFDGAAKAITGTRNFGSAGAALGETISAAMTCDGTTLRGYQNGLADGTLAAGASYTGYTTPGVRVGAKVANFGGFGIDSERFDGIVETFWSWSRILSANELLWLHTEPYAMLRPIIRRRSFTLPSIQTVTPTVQDLPSSVLGPAVLIVGPGTASKPGPGQKVKIRRGGLYTEPRRARILQEDSELLRLGVL